MQINPNDPNYPPPMEEIQPNSLYQPASPPYQSQPGVPLYQGQPEEPIYYSQPTVPHTPPADQYAAVPPRASRRAAQEKAQARKYSIAKVMDYLQWLLVALEMLFLLRFILMLVGADPTNPFCVFLYTLTGFFLAPFEGIVPSTKLGTQGYAVIEWSTLVGMAVYAVIFYLLKLLLHVTISRPEEPIEY
jgi:uncharacterized protein YggT (Ycf19 family)